MKTQTKEILFILSVFLVGGLFGVLGTLHFTQEKHRQCEEEQVTIFEHGNLRFDTATVCR